MFSMIWKKLVLWKIQCFFWLFLFNILREWILPPSCLSTAEDVLCSVPGLAVEVSSVIKKMFFYCSNILFIAFLLSWLNLYAVPARVVNSGPVNCRTSYFKVSLISCSYIWLYHTTVSMMQWFFQSLIYSPPFLMSLIIYKIISKMDQMVICSSVYQ